MKNKIVKFFVIIFALIVFISMVAGQNFFFKLRTKLSSFRFNREISTLKAENLYLQTQLSESTSGRSFGLESHTIIPAVAYSAYPFNDKSFLTLSVGTNQNIAINDIVFYENILVGLISDVANKYSTLKTVFNPNWEFPVYIGPHLTQGLFKAGVEPKVVLISKKDKINPGDSIITADPKAFPVRLVIGSVGRIIGAEGNPFWEVSVVLPYNANDLRDVSIRKFE